MNLRLHAVAAHLIIGLSSLLSANTVFAAAFDLALTIDLDPPTRRIAVVAEFVSPGDFSLTLHPSLDVRTATSNGRPLAITTTSAHGTRSWQLAAPKGARIRIEYGGRLPELDATFDHRRVLRSMPPMASVKGSYLPAGSGWYPALPGLFSYSVELSLPSDQRGLVAGTLTKETLPANAADRYTARFEFAQPTEGIDLVAGPYTILEKLVQRDHNRPLRVRTYFYSDLAALADGYVEDSARYIDLYAHEIGPYPYDAFSVVASPLPTGFGMPTLTYLGAQVLKLPFIRATSLGHEVLHNWWGNGVYPDFAGGNWSEGLTTFMADYFYKERESADAAREMRLGWLRDFAAAREGAQLPLTAFKSRTHGAEAAVGYGKAAMVFFMLRDAIGTEAFQRGLRAFWATYKFKVASWDDLRASFESASGRSLTGFFEQWIRRGGGPEIRIMSARAQGDGKTSLDMTVVQSKPAYALELPVEVSGGAKAEMHRISIAREQQNVTMQLDYTPDRVRVDPDLRIWRVLSATELPPILREWIVSRSPRLLVATAEPNVRRAAEELCQALLESKPQVIGVTDLSRAGNPVLVIGLHADIDPILRTLHEIRPAVVENQGTAQVWTIASNARRPAIAVVSARDVDALRALVRPLPHYGSQSYLAFEGTKAIARGVWRGEAPVVYVNSKPRAVNGKR